MTSVAVDVPQDVTDAATEPTHLEYAPPLATGYDSYLTEPVSHKHSLAHAAAAEAPRSSPPLQSVPSYSGAAPEAGLPPAEELEQLAEVITQLAWQGGDMNFRIMSESIEENIVRFEDVVNLRNTKQQTALYCAANQGHLEFVKYLLKYGAKPNLTERHGSTALHAAAFWGHKDICLELLKYAADARIKNRFGLTARVELIEYAKVSETFTAEKKRELEYYLLAAEQQQSKSNNF